MATVSINFEWSNGESESNEFEATGCLIGAITEYRDDRLSELNADLSDLDDESDEIECEGYDIEDWDGDYSSQEGPDDFGGIDDLDEWAEYCEQVDQHGEAYCLRRADIGDGFDFDDEYNGCWSSVEEFAENFFDDCMECPDSLRSYIDYESFARDLMMDYSEYDGSEGVHVFRS